MTGPRSPSWPLKPDGPLPRAPLGSCRWSVNSALLRTGVPRAGAGLAGGSEWRRGLLEGPPRYYSRQPRSPLGILRPAFPFGKGPTVIQVDPPRLSAVTRTWWFLIHTLTGEFSSWSFQVRGDLQGHLATQRQRKGSPEEEGKESQLLVTELRRPDTQPPVSSSQSPGSHGHWLSPPSIWEAGTDIKACLQHPTPATPPLLGWAPGTQNLLTHSAGNTPVLLHHPAERRA